MNSFVIGMGMVKMDEAEILGHVSTMVRLGVKRKVADLLVRTAVLLGETNDYGTEDGVKPGSFTEVEIREGESILDATRRQRREAGTAELRSRLDEAVRETDDNPDLGRLVFRNADEIAEWPGLATVLRAAGWGVLKPGDLRGVDGKPVSGDVIDMGGELWRVMVEAAQ